MYQSGICTLIASRRPHHYYFPYCYSVSHLITSDFLVSARSKLLAPRLKVAPVSSLVGRKTPVATCLLRRTQPFLRFSQIFLLHTPNVLDTTHFWQIDHELHEETALFAVM